MKIGKYHRNKNVSDVLEHLGWIDSKKPSFIDKMIHGYRICTYSQDENHIKEVVENLRKGTNINVEYRRRGGYGISAGNFDLIIPF